MAIPNVHFIFHFQTLKAEPFVDTGSESSMYPTDAGLQTNVSFY